MVGEEGMMTRKTPFNIVQKVREEVLSEFQRVEGEDYEEWCEFIQYEINARLEEYRKQDLFISSVKYEDI